MTDLDLARQPAAEHAARGKPARAAVDLAAAAERAQRAALTGDTAAAIAAAVELVDLAGWHRDELAVAAVVDHGWTYARLGAALGITRQSAHERYADLVAAGLADLADDVAAGADPDEVRTEWIDDEEGGRHLVYAAGVLVGTIDRDGTATTTSGQRTGPWRTHGAAIAALTGR